MNLLKTLVTMLLLVIMSAHAEDIVLPIIPRPSVLLEGTDRTLTLAQINTLAPWANDSKTSLTNLLKDIEDLSVTEKTERIMIEIKKIVNASAGKNSELFMRYTLNRALVISAMMDKEISRDDIGAADVKLRLLLSSVKMALRYHSKDIAILNNKEHSPYAIYGIEYFNFLVYLNKSVFDATLQYTIGKTALEWLQWDLYRDVDNKTYAPQIVKVNNFLKTLPAAASDDQSAISAVRQIRNFMSKLDIIKAIEDETEQIIGTVVAVTVNTDYFLTKDPNNNNEIVGFIPKGSKVQVIGSRVKGRLLDVIKVKVLEVPNYMDGIRESKPEDVGYIPAQMLNKPVNNPIAFGQSYHVRIGGLFMKSTCGSVKRLGYRDVTFVEDGTIVKILDPKIVRFSGGMFLVIVEDEFVKVKVLEGSTKEGYAPSECVGYAPARLLEAEF